MADDTVDEKCQERGACITKSSAAPIALEIIWNAEAGTLSFATASASVSMANLTDFSCQITASELLKTRTMQHRDRSTPANCLHHVLSLLAEGEAMCSLAVKC